MSIRNAFILTLLGCAASHLNAAEFTYPIEEFENLEIAGGIDLQLRCASVNSLQITADSEDSFNLSRKNKKLKIVSRQNGFWGLFPINVAMTVTRPPENMDMSAGSEIGISNCYRDEGGNLDLVIKAGSLFTLEGNAGSIDQMGIRISSGSIEIAETFNINHLKLKASSGAELETSQSVLISTVDVSISSGASAELCGALAISGKASSGGKVEVAETTQMTHIRTTSGGSIKPNC